MMLAKKVGLRVSTSETSCTRLRFLCPWNSSEYHSPFSRIFPSSIKQSVELPQIITSFHQETAFLLPVFCWSISNFSVHPAAIRFIGTPYLLCLPIYICQIISGWINTDSFVSRVTAVIDTQPKLFFGFLRHCMCLETKNKSFFAGGALCSVRRLLPDLPPGTPGNPCSLPTSGSLPNLMPISNWPPQPSLFLPPSVGRFHTGGQYWASASHLFQCLGLISLVDWISSVQGMLAIFHITSFKHNSSRLLFWFNLNIH